MWWKAVPGSKIGLFNAHVPSFVGESSGLWAHLHDVASSSNWRFFCNVFFHESWVLQVDAGEAGGHSMLCSSGARGVRGWRARLETGLSTCGFTFFTDEHACGIEVVGVPEYDGDDKYPLHITFGTHAHVALRGSLDMTGLALPPFLSGKMEMRGDKFLAL